MKRIESFSGFVAQKSKGRHFVPVLTFVFLLIIVLIILLIPRYESPETQGVTPVVVNEITPAEPISTEKEVDALTPPEDPEALEVEGDAASQEDKPKEDNSKTQKNIPSAGDIAQAKELIEQDTKLIEKRTAELSDMKSMYAILVEDGTDQERIDRYSKLIAKTEKEIGDLKDDINRYKKYLEE